MASAGSAIQAAKAKAIYAAPQFLPAGPINSGRFNLLREVAVGVTLGISLGLVWKVGSLNCCCCCLYTDPPAPAQLHSRYTWQ